MSTALHEYLTSSTAGAKGRIPGNEDWDGSYEGYGKLPACLPGDAFAFIGSIDGTKGCAGNAVCNRIQIVFDIEGGLPIKHTVEFKANGALTRGAAAAAQAVAVGSH